MTPDRRNSYRSTSGSSPARSALTASGQVVLPGWVLLPLRAFLGGTFVFAGLQKLADPNFFDATSSSSIQAQLRTAAARSPIGGLLKVGNHQAVLLGVFIALAELLIGAMTLLGLAGRLAAMGGALLSAGFLLAVSWHSRPYYYGPDIVFLAAWTPLMLGGTGAWSIDSWLQSRAWIEVGRSPTLNVRAPARTPEDVDLQRRTLLAQIRLAGFIAIPLALVGASSAALGRLLGGTAHTRAASPTLGGSGTSTAPTTAPNTSANPSVTASPTTAAPAGTVLGSASKVPAGGAASFVDPKSGDPSYVVHAANGTFRAFSAICTHSGCTVDFNRSTDSFLCPCHGAEFNATTGAVLQGPARRPLPEIPITIEAGNIYRTNS